jgi:hypothetical protein
MKLNRIFVELLLLALIIIERPSGRPAKPHTFPPVLIPIGMSNCQWPLLYLPEPARR